MANDPFEEFLSTVAELRDDDTVHITAHTSSVSADAWTDRTPTPTPTPTPTTEARTTSD